MEHKPKIIDQTHVLTRIACPRCNQQITLFHQLHETPVPNDGIGRLDKGGQNYTWVVCANRACDFEADLKFT